MVSMALLGLNVSVDRVDLPQIMEMQAVLTDRVHCMRPRRMTAENSHAAAARLWDLERPAHRGHQRRRLTGARASMLSPVSARQWYTSTPSTGPAVPRQPSRPQRSC